MYRFCRCTPLPLSILTMSGEDDGVCSALWLNSSKMQNMAKTVRPNHGERKLLVGRIFLHTAAMIWVYQQSQSDVVFPLHIVAPILRVSDEDFEHQ